MEPKLGPATHFLCSQTHPLKPEICKPTPSLNPRTHKSSHPQPQIRIQTQHHPNTSNLAPQSRKTHSPSSTQATPNPNSPKLELTDPYPTEQPTANQPLSLSHRSRPSSLKTAPLQNQRTLASVHPHASVSHPRTHADHRGRRPVPTLSLSFLFPSTLSLPLVFLSSPFFLTAAPLPFSRSSFFSN